MPRYLIGLTDENSARLEAMLGSALRIGPAWDDIFQGVLVASLDGVTDEEAEAILREHEHPVYHHGGPTGAEANAIRAAAASGTLGPTTTDAAVEKMRRRRAHGRPSAPRHGTCTAHARRGTGTGICDRPLDEHGYCDRASDHLEET